jgi:hypothetical protein
MTQKTPELPHEKPEQPSVEERAEFSEASLSPAAQIELEKTAEIGAIARNAREELTKKLGDAGNITPEEIASIERVLKAA